MASIDSVLNAYLEDEGYSWQPTLPVFETNTGAYGLPIGRQKSSVALYQGTLCARFPNASTYGSFKTFWTDNRKTTWTWTCPDDSHVYTCRFRGDRPGYEKEGPEEHVVRFDVVGTY